jgi:nucleotide-binding universal stress UspA family protein
MKRILVGLDEGAGAMLVLREAARLAELIDAKLVLVRAIGVPSHLPMEAYAASPDDVVEVLRQRGAREIADLAQHIAAERVDTVVIDVGRAWEVLCDQARDKDAVLIVIGAHNYGSVDRVLGTTAARIVNHADRSVLVVRDGKTTIAE